jgi:glycosyl transferase family 25
MGDAFERRAEFVDSACRSGMEWDFFDGLSRAEPPLVYDETLSIRRFGRAMRRGEIGCYASHFALWGWFLASDHEQLVVFEDDVLVDWPAIRQVCSQNLASHGIHILKLFTTHPINPRVVRYKLLSDHSHLIGLRGYTLGTQAYILSRQGAQALYKSCRTLTMPIDWAMSRYWDYGVTNYGLFPFPVLERQGPSVIGHAANHESVATPAQRVQRMLWRLRERSARAFADIREAKHPFGAPLDGGSALFPPV